MAAVSSPTLPLGGSPEVLRFNDEVLVGLHVPATVGLKVLLSYQVISSGLILTLITLSILRA
eukprot:752456-Hanusia_phi.AAC.1